MLISLAYKFIHVANVKVGSTCIHNALRPHAQISLPQAEWGKYLGIADIETRFAWIFDKVPLEEFTIFAVMRDPVDWLVSLYRSHAHPGFKDGALYTGNMTFDEFLSDWCRTFPERSMPQVERLKRSDGSIGVTHVLEYERLEEQLNEMLGEIGLPEVALPAEDQIPPDLPYPEIKWLTRLKIKSAYRVDYAMRRKIRVQRSRAEAMALARQ
ncbi:sulfotransferase family 2 domain-containing protein [Chelativorans sp. Marseille-P2723]|uniref:sulfotransferase family 2 domain-containing protein n=1 Tax=Chelativorans sp. Marseille-P2723 TaxID=2709133 RepID=UPI00156EFA49|nr:sulfotransferase family 2 domain-containing protein [Chelativorans sp. Marseille-P2723]